MMEQYFIYQYSRAGEEFIHDLCPCTRDEALDALDMHWWRMTEKERAEYPTLILKNEEERIIGAYCQ